MDFFENYIKFNNFKYDANKSPHENFQRIVELVKPNEKGIQTLTRKFEGRNQEKTKNADKEEKRYSTDVSEIEEFLSENSSKFEEKITSFEKEINSFREDFKRLRGCKSIEDFFDYFKKNYRFKIPKEKDLNSMKIFKELDNYIGWTKFFDEQKNYFKELNIIDKKEYLINFYKEHNLIYDDYYSFEMSFKYLAEKLKWNIQNLARKIFAEIVAIAVREKFDKYDDLREIILRYELRPSNKIPLTVDKCKKLVFKELFVNIYDFAQKNNNVYFRSFPQLVKYTRKNKFYFPLKRPNNNFTYDVLLRRFKH